jgi:8-oxo-dGTP pyrophosphatase MutT (NUDIX family)
MARRDYYDDPQAPKPNSIVPAVTVFVVDDQDRVLLVRRADSNRWALPGGGVEIGESVAQTAVREVQEETGIDVEVVGFIGVYSDPRHVIAYDDGEVRQQFALCLRGKPTGGVLGGDDESAEVRWVPASELSSLDIHPSMRLRIDHGLAESSAPYVG